MAAKATEEILQCPICLERFTIPRTLPQCLHTFCQLCLSRHISREKSQDEVECPICRRKTPPPSGGKMPKSQWASLFPLNHMLVTLLDALKIEQSDKPSLKIQETDFSGRGDLTREMLLQKSLYYPRLCHLVRHRVSRGYGFVLRHIGKKQGHFIAEIDPDSPAEEVNLIEGDRILEVNGVNVAHKTHAQVVDMIRGGGDGIKLLVISEEAEMYFQIRRVEIRGDSPDIVKLSNSTPDVVISMPNRPKVTDSDEEQPKYPRSCYLEKCSKVKDYGFLLRSFRDSKTSGHYVCDIASGSPGSRASLLEGDRLIEVNGRNVEEETHPAVIQMIKEATAGINLLVVDRETDIEYKVRGIEIRGDLPEIVQSCG